MVVDHRTEAAVGFGREEPYGGSARVTRANPTLVQIVGQDLASVRDLLLTEMADPRPCGNSASWLQVASTVHEPVRW